jgi:YfiH family protein
MISDAALSGIAHVRHGFFTREGGVSDGAYASLNCGFGSGDAPEAVAENRRRALSRLGPGAAAIVTAYQVHGFEVAVVERPWAHGAAPRADALVTRTPGVALGILTADCAPVLLADAEARVAGAAHAGWRGALGGVVEAAVDAMERLGARRTSIVAAIGPTIGRASYEVGPEFRQAFLHQSAGNDVFFDATSNGKFRFDLGSYVERRLAATGIGTVGRIAADTCAEGDRFFSWRRTSLEGGRDYGRALSVIALAD